MRFRKKTFSDHSFLDEENLINLTPLIDVVFVVLISFILIAPMVQIEKIALAPSGDKPLDMSSRKENLKIYVLENNSLMVNQKKVSFNELEVLAKDFQKLDANAVPCIYHDEKASFGTYQRIKNLLENVGYQEMDVVLKSHEN